MEKGTFEPAGVSKKRAKRGNNPQKSSRKTSRSETHKERIGRRKLFWGGCSEKRGRHKNYLTTAKNETERYSSLGTGRGLGFGQVRSGEEERKPKAREDEKKS